jgi:hypothetical protein
VLNVVSQIKGTAYTEVSEGNIWTEDGLSNRRMEEVAQ